MEHLWNLWAAIGIPFWGKDQTKKFLKGGVQWRGHILIKDILSSLTTISKMGWENDSFGDCVLGLEDYRVEESICVHILPTSQ